jgi:hypothetical protein
LGYGLYFCVSKPSSGHRLHEAETGSRPTKEFCAMSLNFNHVVLNTMPNVIADVDLPTVTLLDLSPADFRRFLTVLVVDSQCCLRTGLFANGIRLAKLCNALSSRSDVTRGLPDLGKSFTLLVCVCFLTSRLTTAKC